MTPQSLINELMDAQASLAEREEEVREAKERVAACEAAISAANIPNGYYSLRAYRDGAYRDFCVLCDAPNVPVITELKTL